MQYKKSKMDKKFKSRKSQITIFVIIAIVIVAAIALVFTISSKAKDNISISPIKDPQGYIQECARKAVSEAELKIIPHGGFIEPSSTNSIKFNNTEVSWMCYTSELNKICTNKHPLLNQEIGKEIVTYAKPKLEECFKTLEDELNKYSYKQDPILNFSVDITPNQIAIKINRQVTFNKNNQIISLNNFNTLVTSPIYTFVSIAIETSNQEVSCNCGEETCNADITAMNQDNLNFEISRFVSGKNEKVYTVIEIPSGKTFNFGIRNCVRMP